MCCVTNAVCCLLVVFLSSLRVVCCWSCVACCSRFDVCVLVGCGLLFVVCCVLFGVVVVLLLNVGVAVAVVVVVWLLLQVRVVCCL